MTAEKHITVLFDGELFQDNKSIVSDVSIQCTTVKNTNTLIFCLHMDGKAPLKDGKKDDYRRKIIKETEPYTFAFNVLYAALEAPGELESKVSVLTDLANEMSLDYITKEDIRKAIITLKDIGTTDDKKTADALEYFFAPR